MSLKALRVWIGRYEFEKIDKGFIPKVKIDYRTFKNKDEFENYLAMFDDSGWNHIYGTKSKGTQYFQQRISEAGEEIFANTYSNSINRTF